MSKDLVVRELLLEIKKEVDKHCVGCVVGVRSVEEICRGELMLKLVWFHFYCVRLLAVHIA